MRLDCLKNVVNRGNSVPGGPDCRIDQRHLPGCAIERLDERSMLCIAVPEKALTVKAKYDVVIPVEKGLKGRDQFFKR